MLVPVTGIEPVRFLRRGILSPLCLPVPPHRQFNLIYSITNHRNRQAIRRIFGRLTHDGGCGKL